MTPEEQAFIQQFEKEKREATAQLLFKCARLVNERAIERLRQATGQHQLRLAHTTLFPHIDYQGTRLTLLAERLGISKQAVSQLVLELEEMGMLESIPDPSDGRAKLITFSKQGQQGLSFGIGLLKEVENELQAMIGAQKWQNLRTALLALEESLEQGPPEHHSAEEQ